jgi:hypothetical protein
LVFASDKKCGCDFLDFKPARESTRFGLVQAQAMADARRTALYGVCGASVFKEKKGPVWVFETKVGYGGLPGPDISVIEPPTLLPSFGKSEKRANQSSEPMRMSVTPRAEPRVAPATTVAHL